MQRLSFMYDYYDLSQEVLLIEK